MVYRVAPARSALGLDRLACLPQSQQQVNSRSTACSMFSKQAMVCRCWTSLSLHYAAATAANPSLFLIPACLQV